MNDRQPQYKPPASAAETRAMLGGLNPQQMREMLEFFSGWSPQGFRYAHQLATMGVVVQDLSAAADSTDNPYGPLAEAKHGRYDAGSAAEVAEGVEPVFRVTEWHEDSPLTVAQAQATGSGR
jgi:hypothetical protein